MAPCWTLLSSNDRKASLRTLPRNRARKLKVHVLAYLAAVLHAHDTFLIARTLIRRPLEATLIPVTPLAPRLARPPQ